MSSDKEPKDKDKKKKGGGMLLKLAIPVVLLGVGGGGMYGLFAAGIIGGGSHEKVKEDNNPKLVRKGEEDPYAPKAEGGKEGEGGFQCRANRPESRNEAGQRPGHPKAKLFTQHHDGVASLHHGVPRLSSGFFGPLAYVLEGATGRLCSIGKSTLKDCRLRL